MFQNILSYDQTNKLYDSQLRRLRPAAAPMTSAAAQRSAASATASTPAWLPTRARLRPSAGLVRTGLPVPVPAGPLGIPSITATQVSSRKQQKIGHFPQKICIPNFFLAFSSIFKG